MNLLSLILRRFTAGELLCYGFSVYICLYSWLPLLDATWSIIDDHEIVGAIGARDRLPITEIPADLGKTEIGDAGIAVRFRPSYYSLRFLEAATWGKRPDIWYAARITISILFALALTSVCLRLGEPILTLGFLTFEFTRPYWSDIFARLGPAEAYAVFGVTLIILGFISATKRGWSALPCIAIAVGVVIAGGSKENFVILAAVPLWLLFSPTIRLSWALKSIFVIALAYLGWIAITVVRGLRHAGHDVYAQPVSIESRLGLLHSLAIRPDVMAWLSICLSLFVLMYIWKSRDDQMRPLSKSLNGYIWAMLAMLAVFASQYVFYFGQWPIGSMPRYLFPGMLAKHIAIFLFFVVVAKIITIQFPILKSGIGIVYLIGALCFLIKVPLQDFSVNRAAAKAMVANTSSFTTRLNEGLDFLKTHPSAALILSSNKVVDYEPLFSIGIYVRASGLTNPIALKLNSYSAGTFSNDPQSLDSMLAVSLERIQNSGGGGFVPLASVDAAECFSMGMSGPPLGRCRSGNTIWP